MMAVYPEQIGRCSQPGCDKPATHRLMRSGTDARALACARHFGAVGKNLASRLNEEYIP